MNLTQKTIAVTGAAQGIGRAIALEFAAAGSDLALIDRNLPRLEETCELARTRGVSARPYLADVADEAQVEATADQIVADFGRFDGIVNNAGILRDALLVKARDGEITGRMSLEQWRAVIDVNLTGTFLCGRAAAERMIRLADGGGVIVNISSVSRHGNAGQSNYSAAKAGVVALAATWAKELARYRIRTGSIAPGFVRTEILAAMKPEILEKMLAPVPVNRLGEPNEIAAAARFIFENEFFSGRCLELDGGLRF
jgi:3-oxoacyl-[acyl-carrier protein] reductase